MPGARRVRKGQTGKGKPAQVRKGGASGSGPDKYDGRSNMQAGTPKNQPKQVGGKGVVVESY